jgi:tRNA threonylcarbamoyladenosine biosynthesis protein TsaE
MGVQQKLVWQHTALDEAATHRLAAHVAKQLAPGDALHLDGALGVGKTTLMRALVHALGHEGRVPSPTYAFIQSYDLAHFTLHHLDLYRLAGPEETEALGLEACFDADAVLCVEWPERGEGVLPPADVRVAWRVDATTGARHTDWYALSARGSALIQAVMHAAQGEA